MSNGPRRRTLLALMAALPVATAARAETAALRRGVNLTNWFRFPPSTDRAALAAYLSDAAMAMLRHAGFDFVRLAVQPGIVLGDPGRLDSVTAAIQRLQRHGLAVIVGPHPVDWRLSSDAAARAALLDFWSLLAPRLRPLDAGLTIPEVLNEPVFADDAAAWTALQCNVLGVIRASLPRRRVLLTGNDWGGVDGLVALSPVDDPDVLYSFHFYEPTELTALAAYRPALDRGAFARLPFPVTGPGCTEAAATPDPPTRELVRYVCEENWDAGRVDARIAAAAAWGQRHGVPVLLGEFGASARLNAPARLAWLAAVRCACDRHGIGWALWGYDDSMGFGVRPSASPPVLDHGVLEALGMQLS